MVDNGDTDGTRNLYGIVSLTCTIHVRVADILDEKTLHGLNGDVLLIALKAHGNPIDLTQIRLEQVRVLVRVRLRSLIRPIIRFRSVSDRRLRLLFRSRRNQIVSRRVDRVVGNAAGTFVLRYRREIRGWFRVVLHVFPETRRVSVPFPASGHLASVRFLEIISKYFR